MRKSYSYLGRNRFRTCGSNSDFISKINGGRSRRTFIQGNRIDFKKYKKNRFGPECIGCMWIDGDDKEWCSEIEDCARRKE